MTLTEAGNEHCVELLKAAALGDRRSLRRRERLDVVHHVNQALRAHTLFTARQGLHRPRKDGSRHHRRVHRPHDAGPPLLRRPAPGAGSQGASVPVQPENQTLASITFQNYFRLYDKLAGMTGTALTEAAEFIDIYKLEVMEVPTNMPVAAHRRRRRGLSHRRTRRTTPSSSWSRNAASAASRAGRHHLDREVAEFMNLLSAASIRWRSTRRSSTAC